MDRIRRESWNANGHVFSTLRGAVTNPLTFPGDNRLTRPDLQHSFVMLDVQRAVQYHREFIEIRALAGLRPSGRAAHAGDADLRFAVVDAADVFFDDLVPRDRDQVGSGDEFRHGSSVSFARVPPEGRWGRAR